MYTYLNFLEILSKENGNMDEIILCRIILILKMEFKTP